MKQSKIITGIDIGTSKISAIVCQLKSADNRGIGHGDQYT